MEQQQQSEGILRGLAQTVIAGARAAESRIPEGVLIVARSNAEALSYLQEMAGITPTTTTTVDAPARPVRDRAAEARRSAATRKANAAAAAKAAAAKANANKTQPKRNLSKAGREAIQKALKQRWAKHNAAKAAALKATAAKARAADQRKKPGEKVAAAV